MEFDCRLARAASRPNLLAEWDSLRAAPLVEISDSPVKDLAPSSHALPTQALSAREAYKRYQAYLEAAQYKLDTMNLEDGKPKDLPACEPSTSVAAADVVAEGRECDKYWGERHNGKGNPFLSVVLL